jgi:hypothetical protein
MRSITCFKFCDTQNYIGHVRTVSMAKFSTTVWCQITFFKHDDISLVLIWHMYRSTKGVSLQMWPCVVTAEGRSPQKNWNRTKARSQSARSTSGFHYFAKRIFRKVCWSNRLSVCVFVCLCVCLFVCLCVSLSVRPLETTILDQSSSLSSSWFS